MLRGLVEIDGGVFPRRRLRVLAGTLVALLFLAWSTGSDRSLGDGSASGSGPGVETTTTTAPPEPPGSNVPMERLAPGEEPPQFVLFSFDGGGWHERWQSFTAAAEPHDARFTVFLTGIYLLADDNRDLYTGPGHSAGRASIGFGGTRDDVQRLVDDLNQAWLAGHEIGTHYNGHFCDGNDPSGNDWSAADWRSEILQFGGLWQDWVANNQITDPRPLLPPLDEVRGGRTPCLEGRWDQLAVAWAEAGYRYDTSMVGRGMAWPKVQYGVWQFPVPTVDAPGIGRVVAMDYNLWVNMNDGRDEPDRADEMRGQVLDTYRHMYDAAFAGNRAPLVIGNHFNEWSGNAFNPAVADFMDEVCGEPETYCATYADVIEWMELQDPAVLAALQEREPVF
jgi:hypothetical protein